jgi:hypothetical protein
VTAPAPSTPPAPALLLPAEWRRPLLLLGGGLVATDLVGHLLHGLGGGVASAGALTAGAWLLLRRRSRPPFTAPSGLEGWIARCEGLLDQFERLNPEDFETNTQRRQRLEGWCSERESRAPRLALVGTRPPGDGLRPLVLQALSGPAGLRLDWGHPLPGRSSDWVWPETFRRSDAFLHHLHLPLTAGDLRWLEALPAGLPVWLLLQGPDGDPDAELLQDLRSQWPQAEPDRWLLWDGRPASLVAVLDPLARWLGREAPALLAATPLRGLEALHRDWQKELEGLRRQEWQRLQQRTQWVVAAGVFASPLPSVDLLVLAAANGLMLQEMARLWDSPWTLVQLRDAAGELARAALAQGVVEWSSQALLGAMRLEGATWIVGGALQALSAAYLTRVVGLAMADLMALSVGLAEPDLAAVRRQAPLLVARAAEAGRLDWVGFLRQGRRWLEEQGPGAGPGTLNPAS